MNWSVSLTTPHDFTTSYLSLRSSVTISPPQGLCTGSALCLECLSPDICMAYCLTSKSLLICHLLLVPALHTLIKLCCCPSLGPLAVLGFVFLLQWSLPSSILRNFFIKLIAYCPPPLLDPQPHEGGAFSGFFMGASQASKTEPITWQALNTVLSDELNE